MAAPGEVASGQARQRLRGARNTGRIQRVSPTILSLPMPTKTHYIDATQTDGLCATWSLFLRNFRLKYKGRELGYLTPTELKADQENNATEAANLPPLL